MDPRPLLLSDERGSTVVVPILPRLSLGENFRKEDVKALLGKIEARLWEIARLVQEVKKAGGAVAQVKDEVHLRLPLPRAEARAFLRRVGLRWKEPGGEEFPEGGGACRRVQNRRAVHEVV